VAKPLAADEATELIRVGLAPWDTAVCADAGAEPLAAPAVLPDRPRRPWTRALWLSVLPAAVLSLTGGVLTLSRARPASVSQTQANQAETLDAMRVANPGAPAPATVAPPVAATQTAAPAAARAAEPAAVRVAGPKGPTAAVLDVVHLHVFGGCRGRLRLSQAGLTYTPNDASAKDGFTLAGGSFTPSLHDDTLTIKAASRTYRFKSSVKGDRESIRDLAAAMSRFR
jgi:hypothetical protein